jgi:RecJ-like exonuclease
MKLKQLQEAKYANSSNTFETLSENILNAVNGQIIKDEPITCEYCEGTGEEEDGEECDSCDGTGANDEFTQTSSELYWMDDATDLKIIQPDLNLDTHQVIKRITPVVGVQPKLDNSEPVAQWKAGKYTVDFIEYDNEIWVMETP